MASGSIPFGYNLPAFIREPGLTDQQYNELSSRWRVNLTGWVAQNMPESPPPSYFYDPANVMFSASDAAALVDWFPFPNRLMEFYSDKNTSNPYQLSTTQMYQLADTGYYVDSNKKTATFQPIPSTLCPAIDWTSPLMPFGPHGPRGWLDEYCEWSVCRDATSGNIVRIDFTCENPEYWNTLWKVSPDTVTALYNSILNYDAPTEYQVAVQKEDLELLDANNNKVIDPETKRAAYNPLNKWNCGTTSVRTGDSSTSSGGAIHLTSSPNTLQTELGLAAGATPQFDPTTKRRKNTIYLGNSDPQLLICCGVYGQEYRNSDPHIGQTVNQVVGGSRNGEAPATTGQYVNLADPMGLYIQRLTTPANFTFGPNVLPDVMKIDGVEQYASDVWQVVRGLPLNPNVPGPPVPGPIDPVTNAPFPGDMILHVVCQIPSKWLAIQPDLTLADIEIGGSSITSAGMVAYQFKIGLFARPLPAANPPANVGCAPNPPTSQPGEPLQVLFFSDVWNAMYATPEPAPNNVSMPLASNSTFIAPRIKSDVPAYPMSLTCAAFSAPLVGPPWPSVTFWMPDGTQDKNVTATVSSVTTGVSYAIPGNTYPPPSDQAYTVLNLLVQSKLNYVSGLRAVQVTDPTTGNSNTLAAAIYIIATELPK